MQMRSACFGVRAFYVVFSLSNVLLLTGEVSSGKTAIASKLAAESDFAFIRMISADSMIGSNDSQRCATLLKTFTDSYRSAQR